ncbi:ATP-binding cassette domain-containing protein [Georgenia yuyongxinii]|uniref:ABC transporter ATP-binding protein n=1 Tax=Georgenia yuyongxinii TaxID=2589797 RepID=A0A552WS37_9MICO|nr:ABC transporter ATP-binding protein [Georgenia yuyongxinii]TRW45564.1 ABC transporter ATP-binding protein [Georgenia yuyongxinii]
MTAAPVLSVAGLSVLAGEARDTAGARDAAGARGAADDRGTGEPARRLVDDLSFTVAAGERLAIIGESGSGKSLTALAVAGLLAPGLQASGSVSVAGSEVVGAPEAVLNRVRGAGVSLVFQEPRTALDPLMRIGRQIAEPLRRHRGLRGTELRDGMRGLMREVALPERAEQAFPHEVSGGQRQRVAIAMALACDPKVLIADEPTTALDVTVQAGILELLQREVRDRDMALVFITHDMGVVAEVAERVVVLRSGRKVEEGSVAGTIAAPQHPYTQRLVEGARLLDAALAGTWSPSAVTGPVGGPPGVDGSPER